MLQNGYIQSEYELWLGILLLLRPNENKRLLLKVMSFFMGIKGFPKEIVGVQFEEIQEDSTMTL